MVLPAICVAGAQVSIIPGVAERFELTEVVEQTGEHSHPACTFAQPAACLHGTAGARLSQVDGVQELFEILVACSYNRAPCIARLQGAHTVHAGVSRRCSQMTRTAFDVARSGASAA